MKLEYVRGDLTKAKEYVIIHGCNAKGKMNSGVAKAIRETYPQAYDVYMAIYNRYGLNTGEVQFVSCGDKLVVNCITQDRYGYDKDKYCCYDAIRESIRRVHSYCKTGNIDRFALPMIGAGLGGGDWNIISQIIEMECKEVQPVVYFI